MSTCTGEAGNPIRPSSFAPWESRGFMQLKQFYSIHSDYFPLLYIISMLTENRKVSSGNRIKYLSLQDLFTFMFVCKLFSFSRN